MRLGTLQELDFGNDVRRRNDQLIGGAVTIAHIAPARAYCVWEIDGAERRAGAIAICVAICFSALRLSKDIGSASEVNRLVDELLCRCLPSVDFAHGDLTNSNQIPDGTGELDAKETVLVKGDNSLSFVDFCEDGEDSIPSSPSPQMTDHPNRFISS
jgi:hypothetical protein